MHGGVLEQPLPLIDIILIMTLLLQVGIDKMLGSRLDSVPVWNIGTCKERDMILVHYTANIFNVIFTVFTCVPFSNVIPLYGLHLITASSTVEKCKHWFTVVYCNIYTSTV